MDLLVTVRRAKGEFLRTGFAVMATASIVLAAQGCAQQAGESASDPISSETAPAVVEAAHHENAEGSGDKVAGLSNAICVLSATEGNAVTGTISFEQTDEGVRIKAHVMGLTPGKHGFHIHEFGDISGSNGKTTGGHYNPAGHDHSAPDSEMRHVGDLGNLEADESGMAMYDAVATGIKVHDILARGITIHAGEDDLTSQPTGAAGARVAVGVIGLAKTE